MAVKYRTDEEMLVRGTLPRTEPVATSLEFPLGSVDPKPQGPSKAFGGTQPRSNVTELRDAKRPIVHRKM